MGSFLEAVFGAQRAISVPEMAVRAVIIYVVGLLIVRFAKNRLLGRSTAFDIILGFILGSLFSRAINGRCWRRWWPARCSPRSTGVWRC